MMLTAMHSKPGIIRSVFTPRSNFVYTEMAGRTAIRVLQAMLPRILQTPRQHLGSLRELLAMPPIVKYEHSDSCLAGQGDTQYIVQRTAGIFQSICEFILLLTST